MAKVIRQITYEGDPGRLAYWLDHSLADGVSEMLPGLTIQTTYSDIDHEKFGSVPHDRPYEGIEAYEEANGKTPR